MAGYTANVQVDTYTDAPFVSGGQQTSTIPVANATFVRQQFASFFVDFEGAFTAFPPQAVAGAITKITKYQGIASSNSPFPEGTPIQESYFNSDGVDATQITSLLGVQLSQFLFKDDDVVVGSPFADKLGGWDGDDNIFGNEGGDLIHGGNGEDLCMGGPGKDNLWGETGADTFVYADGFQKDRLNDFDRKADAIVIDRDLARSQNKLVKLAEQKGRNAVFDFGDGDKLFIANVDITKLGKVSFSFLEFDNF